MREICKYCLAFFVAARANSHDMPPPPRVFIDRCVVALDLSYTGTGVCVMAGHRYETHAFSFGDPPAHPGERLAFIFDGIEKLIVEHQPHLVVAERAFVAREKKGAANMGVLLGALHGQPQALAYKNGAAFRHVDNASYRSAILGFVPRGDDVKGQIATRLRQMGVRFKTDDEADAYCLAQYATNLLRAHGGQLPPVEVKSAKKKNADKKLRALAGLTTKKTRRTKAA